MMLLIGGISGRAFNISWISTVVSQYIKAADIGKTGGCHLFRHTMATLMLENGADIRFIQAMLGHAELSTTQIYTQVVMRQLQAVHDATYPAGLEIEANSLDDEEKARDELVERLNDEADTRH